MTSLTAVPAAPASMRDVFLARQPIFDARLNVVGYEVLFRASDEGRAAIVDGNRATSEVLLNAFVEIGLERVVGEHQAYVNLTRDFLTGHLPLPLASDRIVLEMLEDVSIDAELIAGVSQLVDDGYTLALDDAVFHEQLEPLLRIAQIVKVDLPRYRNATTLKQHLDRFRMYPVRLLAEKVETADEFECCRRLGFDYFQGYFLSRPQVLHARQQRNCHLAVLQLMSRLADPQVNVDELERIIRSDAALSYKLLRYINSSKFALKRKVESHRHAIVMLGLHGVRMLATLVSLAGTTRKPSEVLTNATLRAVFCERLARRVNRRDVHAYFMAGLLSSLDAVLDLPLCDILGSLPVSDEIQSAVLRHEGSIGEAVRCVLAVERADWPAISCESLSPAEIRGAYLEAIAESRQVWAELGR